jgi:hypothetical protein
MYHRLKQAFCSVTRQSKFYQANALLSYAAKKDHEETNEVSILLPHMFIRTRPNCLEEIKKREDKTQSQTYKIYSIKQKEVYILIKNMESNHIPFYNNQSFFFFLSQKNILITELEFLSITFVFAQSVKKHLIFFLHLLQTLQLIQHQISLSLSVTTTLSKLCPENIKRK